MKTTKFVVRWDYTDWTDDDDPIYGSGESNTFISHITTDALRAAQNLRNEMQVDARAWAEIGIDVFNIRVVRIREDVVVC